MDFLQAFFILNVISVTYGLTCLSCESVAHPFLCEHTMQCHDGSICSVEKIVNSGDTTYKLGCIDTAKCHSKRSSFGTDFETCRECCATDGCNLNGCGKDSIIIKRGPICFDCEGISDPSNCHRVKVCESDEVCLTQETFRWNIKLVKTSCENLHICQAISGKVPIFGRRKRSLNLEQKRSVLCSECCSTDLCNRQCGDMFKLTTSSSSKSTHMRTLPTQPVSTTENSLKSMATGYYEYYILFIESYESDRKSPEVYILATHPGIAFIFSMHEHVNQSILLSEGENKFNYPSSVITNDGIESKGFYIHASVPIIVSAFTVYYDKSDGYLAIPSLFLSNNYIVPTFKDNKDQRESESKLGIVATKNTTTLVKIKLKLRFNSTLSFNSTYYYNGDIISVFLSELETIQISHHSDLSGSIITSSEPVGVVSGNQCSSIAQGIRYGCNRLIEMVLPTNQLDNIFIVPNIKGRNRRIVRIFCPLATQLQIVTIFTRYDVTVDREDIYEFEDSQVSYIKSNQDVLVMIYPKETVKGGSFMMTIYGVNQYKSSYDIIVPALQNLTSYISMTLQSGVAEGFKIDNNIVYANTYYNKTISGKTYTSVTYSINAGVHTISHPSNERFGLWVYGDHRYSSYGFPGLMAYTKYP